MFAVVALSESYFGSGSSFCNLVLLSVTGTSVLVMDQHITIIYFFSSESCIF